MKCGRSDIYNSCSPVCHHGRRCRVSHWCWCRMTRALSGCACECSMCNATQAVKCGVASSMASVSLSFRSQLYNFTFPLCRPDSPCCDTVSVHPTLSRSHFSHMFSLYSHGILGVVFTEDVDLGEPTSFHDHVYLGCTRRV